VCDKAFLVSLSKLAQNRTHFNDTAATLHFSVKTLHKYVYFTAIHCIKTSLTRLFPINILHKHCNFTAGARKKMEEERITPKKPEKVSVSAKLEPLGDDNKRPQTALVAENLESIERAIERGIPMTSIWKALQEEGFTLTFRSFESALYRLRKRKAATHPQAPQRPAASKLPQTSPNISTAPPQADPPTTSTPKPGLNIPGYKSKITDKDREEYKALKEAIKDLPDRERRKRMEQFWSQR
jgi:hypothetical protein